MVYKIIFFHDNFTSMNRIIVTTRIYERFPMNEDLIQIIVNGIIEHFPADSAFSGI